MAQIAIPVLLVGVAYLMSNDEEPSEGFSNIDEEKNQGNLLANENKIDELSIGMSDDYEIALQFNPTYIRLGTILFGKRL